MTAPVWTTPAGFLGTLTERSLMTAYVQASGQSVTYSVISGSLPGGLRLNSTTGLIAGSPSSVSQTRNFSFAIRATSGSDIADRTFNFDVSGTSSPLWLTPAGALPVGLNGEYYSINKEPVNYTVRAETDILMPGNTLKYFIADTEGQLPPGLTLSSSGKITGYVDDLLKLDAIASVTGGYDEEYYDGYPYDHSPFVQSFLDSAKPTSISKIYQFYITVTDGIISSKRLFTITVLDPDSLRADTTYILSDTDTTNASSSQLLAPLWQNKNGELLPSVYNLGVVRAAKNQIITLHEYDPYKNQGTAESPVYDWNNVVVNPDIKFITDSRIDLTELPEKNLKGQQALYFKNTKILPVAGMKIRFSDTFADVDGVPFDNTVYVVTGVISLGNDSGIMNLNQPLARDIPDSRIAYVGTPSQHPPGINLDPNTGELYGQFPYQPAYSTSYRFTINLVKTSNESSNNTVSVTQIFILTVKGNIDSSIEFTSPTNLGTIFPGQVSELAVTAVNVNTDNNVQFEVVQGALPEGLTLNSDGTVQGITSFRNQHIIYDTTSSDRQNVLTLDANDTTIDRSYYFTIRAYDVYKLSAVEKEFYITVIPDLNLDFSRMYVKPFLPIKPVDKRAVYRSFVANTTIFDPAVIYRPNDPEFGVQKQIKMLIETGIETVDLDIYAQAMSQYFSRKRFYFGDIKSIQAQDSNGNNVYELVYVDMIDNQMISSTTPSYAVSVANMQLQLEEIQLDPTTVITVNEHLRPRYMTTLQPSTGVPIGFIKAVPICYTIPGGASKVLSRIKNSGFDFKQFDFDTDRLVVETVQNDSQTNWLAYPTNAQ